MAHGDDDDDRTGSVVSSTEFTTRAYYSTASDVPGSVHQTVRLPVSLVYDVHPAPLSDSNWSARIVVDENPVALRTLFNGTDGPYDARARTVRGPRASIKFTAGVFRSFTSFRARPTNRRTRLSTRRSSRFKSNKLNARSFIRYGRVPGDGFQPFSQYYYRYDYYCCKLFWTD